MSTRQKIIMSILILLLALVLPLHAKPVPLETSVIPENTQWVLHFDVNKFASTHLCALLMEDDASPFNKTSRKIFEKFKIDFLKDIAWITLFGQGKDKDKAAFCCWGNFNRDYLLSLLDKEITHREIRYGKYNIHTWGSQFGTFANNHLFLVSKNENMIKNVLDVIDGKKKNLTAGKMMPYLKEIPEDAFFKAVVDDVSSMTGNHARTVILKKTSMAVFIALEKNRNLKLKTKMTTDSVDTAKNIEQIANGLIALAKIQHKEKDPRLKFLNAVKISLKGNIVQIELSVPSKELVDIISHGKRKSHFKH